MEEVRRQLDDELCGLVERRDGVWCALVVFGVVLGRHDERGAAVEQVLRDGLAVLAERWTLRNGETRDEQIVCIQEATTEAVTVALDFYSLPGVPTLTITSAQISAGEWQLEPL